MTSSTASENLVTPRTSSASGQSVPARLEAIYSWVETNAISTINWYFQEKKSKAFWSRFFRIGALLLVSAGTVTPVVLVAAGMTSSALWGYVLLGLGAACIGVDRALGFSSSWTRYVASAIKMRKILARFQVQWSLFDQLEQVADVNSGRAKMIVDFVSQIESVVEDETLAWVTEFHSNLSILESGVRDGGGSRTDALAH